MSNARIRTIASAAVLLLSMLAGCNRSPEARRDKYLAKGKEYMKAQNYSKAVLEFKNAVQAMPKDDDSYYQLGLAYAANTDFRLALTSFRRAIELNPNHFGSRLRIAQMMSETNNPELLKEAEDRLKSLGGDNADQPEVLTTLAFTQLKLGDTSTAIQNFEQALAKAPGQLGASVLLAKAKVGQKDLKGAEDVLKKSCNDAPQSVDARRILGDFYADFKRFPEAEEQYRRALSMDPKNGPVLYDLARLMNAQGRKQDAEQLFKQLSATETYRSVYGAFLFRERRTAEAVREFERVSKAFPEDRDARRTLIAVYRSVNRPADANKILAEALKKNPNDLDALLQRAETFIADGKYDQAETDLNQVIKLKPNGPDVHYLKAQLNQARGQNLTYRQELTEVLRLNPLLLAVRVELARSLATGGAGEAKAALDVLNGAPASQQNSPAILAQRNWALWGMGDMAGMRQGIDAGLARERSAELLTQDGLWKLRTGNAAGARASLEEALKIDSSDLMAVQALAQSYVEQKNSPMALQKIKDYAAAQPKNAAAQEFLGMALIANGDRAGARAALLAAKAADPGRVSTDMALIQLDAAEGKVDDAKAKLSSVLAGKGDKATATLWMGNLDEMKGDHNSAIVNFRKAVAENPRNAQAMNNLAYLLAENGNQIEEALKYAQTAVELNPKDPSYADTLGWILYRKGLYSQAIPYLQKASADQESVVWKYHLAMAYAKAGDLARGRATLQAAKKVDSTVPEARVAEQLLATAQSKP